MLQLLILWVSTYLISKGVDVSLVLRMFKDVADCGYKLKIKRLSDFVNSAQPKQEQKTFIIKLIPVLNVLYSFKNMIDYSNFRAQFLDELNVLDCVEEMTSKEKELYEKKSTGLAAMVISLINEISSKKINDKSKEIITITFNENGQEGKISFKYNDKRIENDVDFDIVSAQGIAADMSVEEQKQKVRYEFQKLGEAIKSKYGSIENFAEKLKLDERISIVLEEENNNNKLDKKSDDKSTEEKISELKNYKKELLNSKNSESNEKGKDGYSYKKKK